MFTSAPLAAAVAPTAAVDWFWVSASVSLVGLGLLAVAVALLRMRTKRLRMLQASEERYSTLFENAAVPILEEDFTPVSHWMDQLREKGIDDLAAHLRVHPDLIVEQFRRVRITSANRRGLELLGADDVEHLAELKDNGGYVCPTEVFAQELEALWHGRTEFSCDLALKVGNRPLRRGIIRWTMLRRAGAPDPSRVMLTFTDHSELRATEERYLNLFEGLPDAAWVFDPETLRFLDVNGAAVRRYGWTRAEFLTLRATEIRPDEDKAGFELAVADCVRYGHAASVRRHRSKDGRYLDVEVLSRLVEIEGKQAILSIGRDVTDQLRSAEALRVSEERFRRLFEYAVEGVYESKPTGGFANVNPAFARMLGYATPAEMLAATEDHMEKLYVNPTRRDDFFERLGAADQLVDFESEVYKADGSRCWISENVRAVRDPAGRLTHLQGFVTDITSRKRAEAALRGSESRHRALFEQSPVAIVEFDYSKLRDAFDELRLEGVSDFTAHALANRELGLRVLGLAQPVGMNESAVRALGGNSKEHVIASFMQILTPEAIEVRLRSLAVLWRGGNQTEGELPLRRLDGKLRHFFFRWWMPLIDGKPSFERTQIALIDVTDLRQTEAALRTSEQRYRMLFEHSPVGVVEYDYRPAAAWVESVRASGVTDFPAWLDAHPAEFTAAAMRVPCVGANHTALRLVGAGSLDEALANVSRIFTPEIFTARRTAFIAVWNGTNENEGETTLRSIDGSLRRVYQHWWVPTVDGRPYYERTQLAFLDLTAIKSAEAALKASEGRFRTLLEQSPVAVVEHDYREAKATLDALRRDGVTDLATHMEARPEFTAKLIEQTKFVTINKAAVSLFAGGGPMDEQTIATRLREPAVQRARKGNYLALWRGALAHEGEIIYDAANGKRWHFVHKWSVPIIDGAPAYQWTQTVLLDITSIRTAEAALADERERLAVTLRGMTEGVISTNRAGNVSFINEAACELTGWPENEAVGQSLTEIFALRHELTDAVLDAPAAAALARDCAIDLPPRAQLLRRGGAPVLVEGRCAPMHDPSGRAIGAVLVLRDVTERGRLQAELQRAAKLESIGVLAGGIAHDFNNLLTIVMGNLSLALQDKPTAPVANWLREAERGTKRARDLTRQLLTFAKGGDPVRSAIHLPEVVREAAEFAVHGAKVRCEFDLPDNLRAADADKGQIAQVVHNLVLNATQAMHGGGIIRIALRNETLAFDQPPLPAGEYLQLTLSDQGPGIAPENLSHIFEPYFTTKDGGSGLGLATVYSIVRKHRGHITVESQLDRGTTFRIWLPAAKEAPPASSTSRSPFETLKGRILFMDDEEAIRSLTQALLTRLGIEVTLTADGESAVKEFSAARVAGRPYDAVMMDLTVPGGMGGRDAMKAILAIDPAARGIVSSGYSSDPVLANYRAHGFMAVVPKPYRVNDLTRALREVLKKTAE